MLWGQFCNFKPRLSPKKWCQRLLTITSMLSVRPAFSEKKASCHGLSGEMTNTLSSSFLCRRPKTKCTKIGIAAKDPVNHVSRLSANADRMMAREAIQSSTSFSPVTQRGWVNGTMCVRERCSDVKYGGRPLSRWYHQNQRNWRVRRRS